MKFIHCYSISLLAYLRLEEWSVLRYQESVLSDTFIKFLCFSVQLYCMLFVFILVDCVIGYYLENYFLPDQCPFLINLLVIFAVTDLYHMYVKVFEIDTN